MCGTCMVAFCFAILSIASFLPIPLLSYDSGSGSFLPYDYSPLFITCFILALAFERNYMSFAVILYIVMGLIGFPIFAQGGGLEYIMEPGFLYLLALIPLSIFAFLFKHLDGLPLIPRFLINNSALLAIFIAHAAGLVLLLVTARLNMSNFLSLSFYQFIYDLIFALIAVIIYTRLKPKCD